MSSSGSLTIASLNMHGGVDRHGQPYDLEAACHQLKADVIALQEVFRPTGQPDPLAAVANALGLQVVFKGLAARTSLQRLRVGPQTGPGDWGIAVLTACPVISYQVVDLGRAPGDALPRAAQVMTLRTPGARALRVANTHLTHRFTSPMQLLWLAGRLAAGTEPTVITGDLNMPSLATLVAPRYRRVVHGPTYPAHRPLIQLDHLLASPGVSADAAEVVAGVGSDHLPIRAHLSIR
ncbi:MAG: endonuclease/exonuclease/phosphatase family protein [Actinomycetota bacterium]